MNEPTGGSYDGIAAKAERVVYVYALRDPRNGAVRYIGITTAPQVRWTNHCNSRERSHNGNWIRLLRALGLRPLMEIVDRTDGKTWQGVEAKWIAEMRAVGYDLTNTATGGGPGVALTLEHRLKIGEARRGKGGHRWTAEERERIRQQMRDRRLTEEHKAKIGAALRGRRLSDQQREGIRRRWDDLDYRHRASERLRGRPVSEETRRKLSNARKGHPLSREHKQKSAATLRSLPRGPLSPERLSALREMTRTLAWRQAVSEANKGRPKSEEHRRKLSEASKRWHEARRRSSEGPMHA